MYTLSTLTWRLMFAQEDSSHCRSFICSTTWTGIYTATRKFWWAAPGEAAAAAKVVDGAIAITRKRASPARNFTRDTPNRNWEHSHQGMIERTHYIGKR